MQRTWDSARVTGTLAELKANGVGVKDIARMAGANRSTIYRWINGEVAPDYSLVNSLARGIYRRYPELARELVEASGYAWAEPAAEPEPEPDIDADVLAALRRAYAGEPERLAEAIAALERVNSAAPDVAGRSRPPGEPRPPGDPRPRRAG